LSDLRVDLVVPVLRLGAGPLSFDPVEHFVGARICDLLEPLLAGPVAARRLPSGTLVEVFPLRLPAGDGASIVLGRWGELGVGNMNGHLVLTVPRIAAGWVAASLGSGVLDVRELPGRMVAYTIALRPGLRAAWPLGSLGEIAVETPTLP
jgi:hypothetical protein